MVTCNLGGLLIRVISCSHTTSLSKAKLNRDSTELMLLQALLLLQLITKDTVTKRCKISQR
jgi:hypothetical protein